MKQFTKLLILLTASTAVAQDSSDATSTGATFSIETTVAHSGFDGEQCWVHARAGVIPVGQPGNKSDKPFVVMTLQRLLLSGSDVFYSLNETTSADLGTSWTTPIPHESFARQTVGASPGLELPTGASIAPELLRTGDETTVCDFSPMWHAASQRLLGLGQTVWYRDNKVMHVRPRGIAYAIYNSQSNNWSAWQTVILPSEAKFQNAGSGSVQRVDVPGGDVLVPCYFKEPTATQYSVAVCRCRFDGRTLDYVEHGNELTIPAKRGLYEPSLTKFKGRHFMTMRNDDHGYVSVSDDGLQFEPPQRWTFDDGSDLGNYNTQQHWVTHSDGLFLVYTRRGANNDHVFRHRAPLFIAQVDPDKLRVIRKTEQIVVAERGARLGNFGVVDVSPHETWVTVTEWMQPVGVEKYGSDNRVFVAKLKWNSPNRLLEPTAHLSKAARHSEERSASTTKDAWDT
ncbi:MAG: sialidase, partial [Planctomycetota bacterium]|nr:sialidase [Planctomycetota bacterium]